MTIASCSVRLFVLIKDILNGAARNMTISFIMEPQ